jgi:N-methylhydantoinase A
VSLRVAAIGSIPPLRLYQAPAPPGSDPSKAQRSLWFAGVPRPAVVLDRARMPAAFSLVGPAVIESLESTVLLPPRWRGRADENGFIWLSREPAQG